MAANSCLMLKKREESRQERALENAFKKADTDGDGRLSVEEYHRILQEHNIETTREEISRLMEVCGRSNEGFITRAEFLGEKDKAVAQEERVERAFSYMDVNRDGYITKKEMLNLTKRLSQAQVDAVFERNDKDRDGKLSKQEFRDMMSTHRDSRKPEDDVT